MHCDSLLRVNSEEGLINKHNFSTDNPQLQFFAAFVPARGNAPEVRRRELMRLFKVYIHEMGRLGLTQVDDVRSLCSVTDLGKRAAMFTVEGGGGLLADSDEIFSLHKMGLRVMGLAWDDTELASGALSAEDGGLTYEGRRMAARMTELGIVADVSHLSDRSFYGLADAYPLPLIATHSNFRDICPSKRNLTKDMAREIAYRGGVIGLNLYPEFLSGNERATAEDILRHIDYALENFGDSVLGCGFDIDGTRGSYPDGFVEGESIHDKFVNLLLSHYPASTVRRIAGENVIDFLKGVL